MSVPSGEKAACTCGWDRPRGPVCPDCGGHTLWPDSPRSEGSDEESIRERWTRDIPPGAFAESCLPPGCSCGCHNPTYGIHYSHLVPCCDQPDTRVLPPADPEVAS
jgi:hypothetical protein